MEPASPQCHDPHRTVSETSRNDMAPMHRLGISAVGLCGALVLRLLYCTYRWQFRGRAQDANFLRTLARPAIFIFWHGRQLLMPGLYSRLGGPRGMLYALISRHRDGRYLARAIECLGFRSVAGSSLRGGSEALLQLRRSLASGHHVAITPDGPRGPVHKVKSGCLVLARNSGYPIYPVAIGTRRALHFKSWDSMMLPMPFSKVVGVIGEPICVPPDCVGERAERMRERIEQVLVDVTMEADSE